MSSTYLSPSLNFYKHVCSSNDSCISADLGSVGFREVGILFPLCWLACFPNTCFTSPFASQVATATIPVSLWLGSRIVGLKYWRIPVLILKKKNQLLKNNGTYSATFTVVILHKVGNIHYRCFSWNSQIKFIGLTAT